MSGGLTVACFVLMFGRIHTGRLKSRTSRTRERCPCCQLRRFEFLEGARNSAATTLCGRDSVQISVREGGGLNLRELAQRLKAVGKVQINEFLLRFTVDQFEIAVFPDGRGIVRGTKDAHVARSLYARYVGV